MKEESLKDKILFMVGHYNELNRECSAVYLASQIERITRSLGEYYPIEILEKVLSIYKEKSLEFERFLIPDLMVDNGMFSAELTDGSSVDVKTEYSLKVKNETDFEDWLKQNHYEGIIKTKYEFDKGADLADIETELREREIGFQKTNTIHHKTLSKVIKEHLIAGGAAPDTDVAEVKIFNHAVIKGKKE